MIVSDPARPSEATRSFRILSLDGGGIRGAFSAALLAKIEGQLECRIADYFDLIAGTSTGGIIAAALAAGEPASRIVQFYRERGPTIFRRPSRQKTIMSCLLQAVLNCLPARCDLKQAGIDAKWLLSPKYESTALRAALEEVFGERTIEDLRCSRTVIPAVDLTKGQTVVFKTPHLPGLVRDRHLRIADAVLATTAAPTYFPHATIGVGSAYVDGGVWANNPTMVAVAEALRIAQECQRPEIDPCIGLDTISVLSVGTGRAASFTQPPVGGGGIAWWLRPLVELVSMSQSQGVHFESNYVLDDRYYRVDFELPNGSWKLDDVGVVDQLVHLGGEKAVEHLSEIRTRFFGEPTERYTPFGQVELATAQVAG